MQTGERRRAGEHMSKRTQKRCPAALTECDGAGITSTAACYLLYGAGARGNIVMHTV